MIKIVMEKPSKYYWVCKHFDASNQQCKRGNIAFCNAQDFIPSFKKGTV